MGKETKNIYLHLGHTRPAILLPPQLFFQGIVRNGQKD
jgi:hypothetical protein